MLISKKDYHIIGGLKTNRVIYPKGIGIQIKQFTQYIEKNDVHLVTVNNSKYWVYPYEGNLNGIDNEVVLYFAGLKTPLRKIKHYIPFYARILLLMIKISLNIIVSIGLLKYFLDKQKIILD
ncbi:hypothetical protein [Clostridium senegalense]|uniref:Uncharacterized protein n=1 Tax=Clostridium senegalense TaxID=1465809 RepID=A0A6M0H612_9CLOT|nr:hypothetical protein [Clostridium senegalense]NEU05022.1 hypothetical protein [Clostridium senegalense]